MKRCGRCGEGGAVLATAVAADGRATHRHHGCGGLAAAVRAVRERDKRLAHRVLMKGRAVMARPGATESEYQAPSYRGR